MHEIAKARGEGAMESASYLILYVCCVRKNQVETIEHLFLQFRDKKPKKERASSRLMKAWLLGEGLGFAECFFSLQSST